MVVSSMSLSFAGNPNVVNTLPLYTFKIQFMYENLNFFFIMKQIASIFVTFLFRVSILIDISWTFNFFINNNRVVAER